MSEGIQIDRRGTMITLFTQSVCERLAEGNAVIFSPRDEEMPGFGECDLPTNEGLKSFSLGYRLHPQVSSTAIEPTLTTGSIMSDVAVELSDDKPKTSWILPLVAVGVVGLLYMNSRRR